MKKLLLFALFAILSSAAFAQTQVMVKNVSNCTVQYFLYAERPGGCNPNFTSAVYSIPPATTVTWTITSIAWVGTPPPSNYIFIGGAVIDSGPFCTNGSMGVKVGEPCILPSSAVLPPNCSQCSQNPLQVGWSVLSPSLRQLYIM